MTTDLPTGRILALSQRRTFLGVFTYKMAAKTNYHGCGTKLRHCQIKSNEILFAQNTSHLNAASGKSS